MKEYHNATLEALTDDEIQQVGGAVQSGVFHVPRPMDMWGNTTTMEDYMERQRKAAETGDARWVHGSLSPFGW